MHNPIGPIPPSENIATPEWADLQLSQDLPRLRARGEGQDCEYMEIFPQQVRDLGKEIAAFAGTNPGTILIGVDDDGSLIGLAGMSTVQQRDELIRRIEGICRGTIKPSITPAVKWAVETDLVVLVINVPKGSEPIYYSNHIPYVRHLSESRPAEPHEVIDRIRSSMTPRAGSDESDPANTLLSELSSSLIETLIWGEEAEERSVNPWLGQWRAQYEYSAARLREIAASQAAIESGWASDLEQLAKALEAVARFRLYLGCGPEFEKVQNEALRLLREAKKKYTDPIPLSKASIVQARDAIVSIGRQLKSLSERMEEMANDGRLDDLQSDASQHGFSLLKLGHYELKELDPALSSQLRKIGRDLHLVETMPLYMDGGASVQAVLDRIRARAADLTAVIDNLITK